MLGLGSLVFKTVLVQRSIASKKYSDVGYLDKLCLHDSVIDKDKCLVKVICFV